MNRVSLVGRITRDPELRTSPNGVSFVAFAIAVSRIGTNASGERETDFINCVTFNKQAENLARFIKKGGLIGVEGKLQTRRYQAQDGSNRTATEVICDAVHFLESKNSNNSGYSDYSSYEPQYNSTRDGNSFAPQNNNYNKEYNQSPNPTTSTNRSSFDDVKSQFDISDDDLPF